MKRPGLPEVSGRAVSPPGYSAMFRIQVRAVRAEHAGRPQSPSSRAPGGAQGFDRDVDRGSRRHPDHSGQGSRRSPSSPDPAIGVAAKNDDRHAADKCVSAEAACGSLHKALPRKRHGVAASAMTIRAGALSATWPDVGRAVPQYVNAAASISFRCQTDQFWCWLPSLRAQSWMAG